MKNYLFRAEFYNGTVIEETNLTKRQAVIRYNKACKNFDIQRCEWSIIE